MSYNIIKYIEINKSKDWQEFPFNEIDALIFSLLSYIDFTNIVKKPITIKKAHELYKQHAPVKKTLKFFKECLSLLEILANSYRYQNLLLKNFLKSNNDEGQFAAITIKNRQFTFISFEGTDNNLVGWEEDLKLSYQYPVFAQKMAQKYLNKAINLTDTKIYIGGHSKGGNLAIAATFNLNLINRFKIKSIYNFDGPGFLEEEINSIYFKRISKKIKNYFPEESIVGILLNNPVTPVIVKSTNKKIMQHDPFSWLCSDSNFATGELTKFSLVFKSKINNLLTKYSNEQKELFINTIFKILYNSGYKETNELLQIKIKNIYHLIKESIKLSKEEKEIIITALRVLKEKTD